ncbi:MAG: 50S ribosomal protein L29 [Eubacteriales bacterium]|nr:50S ribosomal protein L29 [Eubacteriales bacterium]
MKATELRNKSGEELASMLNDLKTELFNLRFQLAINQLDNPHKIKETKKEIARVMTVIAEKKA